ncbi:MAG TPA: hypothetical protein VL147_11375 [Devosia sp.]|nr:hypothetical protein [Devosia sp.]
MTDDRLNAAKRSNLRPSIDAFRQFQVFPVLERPRHRARPIGVPAGIRLDILDQLTPIADVASYVKADPTDPESEEGLRYDAFIAPLIAAVQVLAQRVEALER